MFKIIKKYRHLLSRRAADDFNRMAAFLTNICGDKSIDFHRPDEPTAENPPSIRVNKNGLASTAAPPADTANGSAGDSDNFSRGNHTHPINVDTTNNPKDIGTAASKGTATTYARSDHVHRVADNSATAKEPETGYVHVSTLPAWNGGLKSDTWSRGNVDSNNKPCGIKMYLPVRIVGDGNDAYIRWRQFVFDQCGCLRYVGGETLQPSPSNACNFTMTEDDE